MSGNINRSEKNLNSPENSGDLFETNSSNSSNITILNKLDTTMNQNSNSNQSYILDNSNLMLSNAVPIPRPRVDFSEFQLDFDASQSPHLIQDNSLSGLSAFGTSNIKNNTATMYLNNGLQSNSNSNAMWSDITGAMGMSKNETFPMDDDDIFQVDKSDLFQGPTLAELNDDTLLDDLNIDDLILPNGETNSMIINSNHSLTTLQPSSSYSNNFVTLLSNSSMPNQQNQMEPMNSSGMQLMNQQRDLYYEDQTNTSTSPYEIYQESTPTKSVNSSNAFSPGSHHSSNSPLINSISPPPANTNYQNQKPIPGMSTLHLLLKKDDYSNQSMLGQSVPGPSTGASMMVAANSAASPSGYHNRRMMAQMQMSNPSRLSSSAPTQSGNWGYDQIWQRREPRQHLLSTGSLAEAGSTSSLSTGGILSPELPDCSQDEGYSDDSDHYEDYSTDADSDDDINNAGRSNSSGRSKKERYFWQYNVQAKGPKGQRLVIKTQLEDPHVLNEVTDPVFSPSCSVRGIKVKHSGKARKGDGNDLTPNPKKLHAIGKELDKLGRVIHDMTPVSELPFNVRPTSRKEKNKLASRACRLKKKAQHEANKIKLFGLENEHKSLIQGIADMKTTLANRAINQYENSEEYQQKIENILKSAIRIQIAGNSTEFVNKVLEKVKSGVPSGGLNEI